MLPKRRHVIGMIRENDHFRLASLIIDRKKVEIDFLAHKKSLEVLDDLRKSKMMVVTGIAGKHLLIRHLHSPLKKKRALRKTFPFQLEAAIPYGLDDVVIKPVYRSGKEEAAALFFVVAKGYLAEHLESWEQVDPECVSAVPMALYRFSRFVCPTAASYFILHVGKRETEIVSVIEAKISRSVTLSLGTDSFLDAYLKDNPCDKEKQQITTVSLDQVDREVFPELSALLKRWETEIIRAQSFLSEKGGRKTLDQVLVTGEVGHPLQLGKWLFDHQLSTFSLLEVPNYREYDAATLKHYAVPIGLSLDAAKEDEMSIQFRQGHFASPRLLKKTKRKLGQSVFLCLGLVCLVFLWMHFSFKGRERALHRKLDEMIAYYGESLPTLGKEKNRGALAIRIQRINALLKRYQKSDKIFATPPLVINLLFYLAMHPKLNRAEEDQKITICSIDYEWISPPTGSRSEQKDQIEVRLVFHSPQAEWAREFHDAMVEDDTIVDGESDIDWNRKGDRYEMAFHLKK